jgi:hypothetical protein
LPSSPLTTKVERSWMRDWRFVEKTSPKRTVKPRPGSNESVPGVLARLVGAAGALVTRVGAVLVAAAPVGLAPVWLAAVWLGFVALVSVALASVGLASVGLASAVLASAVLASVGLAPVALASSAPSGAESLVSCASEEHGDARHRITANQPRAQDMS